MLTVILSVIGAVASIVAFYEFFDNRRNRRIKLLLYETTPPTPLATAGNPEGDYSLSIHYTAAGSGEDEVIEAAFLRYVRFANFGKEPIRREDIAPGNPVRLEVEGSRILDIALSSAGRSVTQVRLDKPEITPERASAGISFDFLDHRDGAIIRVLATTPTPSVRLVGDIIGMPSGIRRLSEVASRRSWSNLSFALVVAGELGTFAAAAWLVQEVTGSWADVWLLALTPIALVLPLIAVNYLVNWWPPHSRRFPKELALPRWLGRPESLYIDEDPTHSLWFDSYVAPGAPKTTNEDSGDSRQVSNQRLGRTR
jgi:hypothetical protein